MNVAYVRAQDPQENFDCDEIVYFAVDECGICNGDGSTCQENNVVPGLFIRSDVDIAGFQFDVNGSTLVSASGGAASDAGFSVSSNSDIGEF